MDKEEGRIFLLKPIYVIKDFAILAVKKEIGVNISEKGHYNTILYVGHFRIKHPERIFLIHKRFVLLTVMLLGHYFVYIMPIKADRYYIS